MTSNNDGNVELVGYCRHQDGRVPLGYEPAFVWILTWNGTSGWWINQIDPPSSQSSIVTCDGFLDFIVLPGSETESIGTVCCSEWQGRYPEWNLPSNDGLVYNWDGITYSLSSYQLTGNDFLPANRITITMAATIQKQAASYIYAYSVTNEMRSKQALHNIVVGGLRNSMKNYYHPISLAFKASSFIDISSAFSPPEWSAMGTSLGACRYFTISTSSEAMVYPGRKRTGYNVFSQAPPSLVRFYAQGYTGWSPYTSDEMKDIDIVSNSQVGFTVAPFDTMLRFLPQDYLDTLSNWYHQADTFGWFKDHATAQKYIDIVSSLRTALQQDDRLQVFDIARQALAGVDADSSGHMTSEAYALVRYCLEYFVTHVPAVAVAPPEGEVLASTTRTFRWRSVPTAATYDLQISTDSTFTAPEFGIAGITDTTTTVTSLETNRLYYWRVSAHVSVGPAGWSPVRTLFGKK